MLRRGIRFEHEPTESCLEIQAWQDFFGSSSSNPDRIEELVISCALSDRASEVVLSLMEAWIRGESFGFVEDRASVLIGTNVLP